MTSSCRSPLPTLGTRHLDVEVTCAPRPTAWFTRYGSDIGVPSRSCPESLQIRPAIVIPMNWKIRNVRDEYRPISSHRQLG